MAEQQAESQVQTQDDGEIRIMVCIDGSKNAEEAFKFYCQHFHKPENKVVFMYVAKLVMPAHVYKGGIGVVLPTVPSKEEIEKEKKRSQELDAKFKELGAELGVTKREFLAFMEGENGLGATIVDVAKHRNIHTIVCGCRGLGAIRRTILGSVSDYVLHHSHVPTLICPMK